MKDSQEDFVVDTSLSILFEPANSRSSCKAKDAQLSTNNADNNDDVEKLVRLLNNYANWELRTLLVGILKDKKVSALQDRLLGTNLGETSDEEQSTGSEKSSSTPVASKSNSHSGNHDLEPDLMAEHGQKPHDHRGSGPGTRRSARTGRITRSLSSERKLDAARRPARESAISARQASILAKRRELDRQRQESSEADCDESPKEDELVASSEHTKPARRNRSLSPAHNIRRSLYETKSLGREHKSGSADNLLGLASHSFHAPGARRGVHNTTRNNRNASFKLVTVPSAHGSGGPERTGTSRGHSPTPTGRNVTRRHSKEQIEVRSSPSSGRRRLLATTKASNHHRESNTPPPVPHHRESHTPPSNHHRDSITPMPLNMNRPRASNAPASFSPPSATTGSDGMAHDNADCEDSAFLQFTVNPISNHEKLTFFATSSRALNNANDIVEELRSSTHDPINIVVGQPREPPVSVVNPTTGSSAEKVVKRGFDLLLRRKRSQLEKLKDKQSGSDHSGFLAHGDSDEESFG